MKKIAYILFIVQIVLFTTACKKDLDSEGVSKLSIKLTLKGDLLLKLPKGQAFVDPGYVAIDGNTNQDVTKKVTIDGTVDGMNAGYYVLTYHAINSDGIEMTATREVIIYDPAAPSTDLTGKYSSNVSRVSPARAFTNLKVTISKLAPGFFSVSDFFGGFYDQGSNYQYGPTYAMSGYFLLNADNTITLLSSFVPGWGDSLKGLTNGKYDSATKTVSWDALYSASNYDFVVNLTFVE